MTDAINHPPHYTQHPSGIECIQITELLNFNLGNAVKYAWRAGLKGDAGEDLQKALWYLDREISRREAIEEREDGDVLYLTDLRALVDRWRTDEPRQQMEVFMCSIVLAAEEPDSMAALRIAQKQLWEMMEDNHG